MRHGKTTVALLLAIAGVSLAQPVPIPIQPIPIQPIPGPIFPGNNVRIFRARAIPREDSQGASTVYVPDSTKAAEQLQLADRLISQKEWGKGVEVYQEIIDTLGDRVAPLDGDPHRYVTVARTVEQRIAHLPPEGLAAYRARYNETAKNRLQAALQQDSQLILREQLTPIQSHYLNTPAGLEAALRLCDLSLDEGDPASALARLIPLLATHPDLQVDGKGLFARPAALFRAIIAARQSGSPAIADTYLKELQSRFPESQGTIAGTESHLVELAAAYMPPVATSRPAINDWPTLGGDETRGALSAASAKANALVASIPLIDPRAPKPTPTLRQNGFGNQPEAPIPQATLYPAVAGSELFFQDGNRVWGVSLDSGLPLPGWAASYKDGILVGPSPNLPTRSAQSYVTITDDSVLATMGGHDSRLGDGPDGNSSRVVRLSRTTGRVIWPKAASSEPSPVRDITLCGAPLVVGANVYVSARGSKGNGFEDAYVVCLDYETGAVRWCTYVASASSIAEYLQDSSRACAAVANLSASGGRVLVQTDLGALAALDATSGRPEWISTYGHVLALDVNAARFSGGQVLPAIAPWGYNPPIVSGGYLFVGPADSNDFLVLDLATGDTVARIPRWTFDNATLLLSASPQSMIVASDKQVFEIDWRRVPQSDLSLSKALAARTWSRDFHTAGALTGRPFATATHLYLPLADKLWKLDRRRGGYLEATTPRENSVKWTDDNGQGNVIVAADKLVVATPTHVEIWTDLDAAESRYKLELQRVPKSAEPKLRWAEVLFSARQNDKVIPLLDEAAALLAAEPNDDSQSDLYATALTMADRMVRRADEPQADRDAAHALALDLFARAHAAARSPDQQIEWRTHQADLLFSTNSFPEAVALWQDMLIDPALRDRATESGAAAAEFARDRIADAIAKSPVAYAPFDARARDALAAATDRSDLLAVAARFPNSASAPKALLRAVRTPRTPTPESPATAPATTLPTTTADDDTAILRELDYRYPNFDQRAEVLEALARAYVAAGRDDVAISRLAAGAKRFPDYKLSAPLVRAAGIPVPGTNFAEARDSLRAAVANLAPPLPDFKLPSHDATDAFRRANHRSVVPATDIPAAAVFVVANFVDPLPGRGRTDRVIIARMDGSICALTPGSATPLWTARLPKGPPTACAWSGDTALIWDEKTLLAIGPDGKIAWQRNVDASPLPDVNTLGPTLVDHPDPAVATNQINGFRGQPVFINGQVRFRGNPFMRAGWNRNLNFNGPPPGPVEETIAQVSLCGSKVVVVSSLGRIAAYSLTGGSPLWQVRPNAGNPDRLVATDDFVAVHFTAADAQEQLVALDADSGQIRWRYASADAAAAMQNVVLAPDGLLIFTTANAICAKDLFDPGVNLTAKRVVPNISFSGLTDPDQLVLWQGLLLAGTANGTVVRAYSVADDFAPAKGPHGKGEFVLSLPGTGEDPVAHMEVSGDHLYLRGLQYLVSVNLKTAEPDWSKRLDSTRQSFSSLSPGRDYLLAVLIPKADGPTDAGLVVRAMLTARDPKTGKESGIAEHELTLPPNATAVRAVQGGIMTLSVEGNLRFYKGNGT
jgi:outer membrane protein assembly factor BamB